MDSSGGTNRKRKRLRILVQAGYTIRIRGHRIYTSSGFALGRVYSITPHPHCITYTYTSAHLNHGIILFLIDDGVKNLWEDVRKREAVRSGKVADLEQELAENKAKQDELRRELLQLQRKEESLQADKKRLELEHEFAVKVS